MDTSARVTPNDSKRHPRVGAGREAKPSGGDPEALSELVEEAPPIAVARPAGLPAGLSLPQQVAALAVWPFLEQILGFLVGFVDTSLAGHISVEATNAVGAAAYILWLVNLLVSTVGVGATALIARAAGAGDWRRANRVLGQSVLLAFMAGLLVGAALYCGAPWIGRVVGLKGKSLELCELYLRILAPAAPLSAVLGIGSACLRGAGDTRTPFFVMVVVNVVNLALAISFVAAPPPLGGWGLRGVGYATMTAWAVGWVCMLWTLLRGRKRLVLYARHLRWRAPVALRVLRIGLPNLLESGGYWIGNFLVLLIVGRLAQPAAVGAHIVVVRIEALSYLPGFAFGMAAATLAGQFLGVGDARGAREAVWWCWKYGGAVMGTLGLCFALIPEVFVRLLTSQPVFLETCPPLLAIVGWAQLGFSACLIFSSALRGAGDTPTAMRITFGSTFLVRLPLVLLLAVGLKGGLFGVWAALSTELVFRGWLFLRAFRRGAWARARV